MPSLLDQSSTPTVNPETYLPGEGNRYKTVEDLAKGKYEADLHIKTLETRLDELRVDFIKEHEANTQRASIEELLAKMQTTQQPVTPPVTPMPTEPNTSPEQIKTLMSQAIRDHESARREDQNIESVQAKLVETYGTNYHTAYKDKLESIGLSAEDADQLARRNPKLVIEAMGLNKPKEPVFQSPMRSSVLGSQTTGNPKKTMSYYKNLRKTNPKAYHDPRIAIEMDRMSQQLGRDFFDDPNEPFIEQ